MTTTSCSTSVARCTGMNPASRSLGAMPKYCSEFSTSETTRCRRHLQGSPSWRRPPDQSYGSGGHRRFQRRQLPGSAWIKMRPTGTPARGRAMAIDPDFFAQQCVRMGLFCGTNPHYMLAVAKLRSGIADTNEGDQIGPFRLTQAQWIANSKESDLGFDFEPDDINLWTNQCSVFALMASRAFATFVTANNRNPSAKELYVAQFPAAASATLSTDLQQAITSTQGLVN